MERGKHGYPIKYYVTVGDYRVATPDEVGMFATREQAVAALGQWVLDGKSAEFPQLFAVEVDYDGDFRDSTRLSTDWTRAAAR